MTGGLGETTAARRLGEANERVSRRAIETARNAGTRAVQAGRSTLGQGAGDMPAALLATVFESGVRTATLPIWMLWGRPAQAEADGLDDAPDRDVVVGEKVEAAEAALAAKVAHLEVLLADRQELGSRVEALRVDLDATQADVASSVSKQHDRAEQLEALQTAIDAKQADLTRALEESSALNRQLETLQDELEKVREASRIKVKSQKWTDTLEGASTRWARLPTPMELKFEGERSSGKT